MKLKHSLLGVVLAAVLAVLGTNISTIAALFPGFSAGTTNGMTGSETIPADTNLSGGRSPQTQLWTFQQLNILPYYLHSATTGSQSVTVTNGYGRLLFTASGTITSVVLTMPSAPIDGQRLRISSDQTITNLTISGAAGQTVKNAPTALTVSTTAAYGYEYQYDSANTTWRRLQ